VTSGVKELRELIAEAQERLGMYGQRTVLFIDEIHRWNKAQQDGLLPYVEDGTVVLIGSTTENPFFSLVNPLLSRSRVFKLNQLTAQDVITVLDQALRDKERGLGHLKIDLTPEAADHLANVSGGDARSALNALELAAQSTQPGKDGVIHIDLPVAQESIQARAVRYDRGDDEHSDTISAFIKSVRGSDPDAALYWMAKMLYAGEDPRFLLRRMFILASEDIGLADPNALLLAIAARDSYHFLGSPEGELAIAEAAIYMAAAPKSNAIYAAYNKALETIKEHGYLPVPLTIRNAPTGLMKNLGYGRGYKYAHDYKEAFVIQDHLPEVLKGMRFYEPTDRGREAAIRDRMRQWEEMAQKQEEKERKKTP